jgi:hypothetical protein
MSTPPCGETSRVEIRTSSSRHPVVQLRLPGTAALLTSSINIVTPPVPSTLAASSPPLTSSTFIADTGASGHYIQVTGAVVNKRPAMQPLTVLMPDGHSLTSTHIGELALPQLPAAARLCHIFPHLNMWSLLSVGQLCDHGCTALFTKHQLYIHQKK